MDEKRMVMAVNDKLSNVMAIIKTVNLAIGNVEYFGSDGQGIAVTLDNTSAELEECRELLASLAKDKEGSR